LPHGFFGKYLAKAENGFHHSTAFTLQNFHEPIMMTEKNSRILQATCVSCHGALMHGSEEVRCVHCHRSVGHGAMTGLGRNR
jgi:cytochrome c nitrite reductase small subunit